MVKAVAKKCMEMNLWGGAYNRLLFLKNHLKPLSLTNR